MPIDFKTEILSQVKCLNKDCGKSLPFRVKVYDGKISVRCSKGCKAVSIEWFMKGKMVFATVVYEKKENGKEKILPVLVGSILPHEKEGGDILPVVL